MRTKFRTLRIVDLDLRFYPSKTADIVLFMIFSGGSSRESGKRTLW